MIVLGIVLLGLAVVSGVILVQDGLSSAKQVWAIPAAVDYAAPDLQLVDLNGDVGSLADFSGRVVLVNNWATWCPPCKQEMPEFQAYFEKYQGQGFVIIGIDQSETAETVRNYVNHYGLTFPIWLDQKNASLTVFNNMSLPNSYVIDRQGRVQLTWTGPINRDILERFVTPLLKEK